MDFKASRSVPGAEQFLWVVSRTALCQIIKYTIDNTFNKYILKTMGGLLDLETKPKIYGGKLMY